MCIVKFEGFFFLKGMGVLNFDLFFIKFRSYYLYKKH
jgi:hypothetical protein